MDKCRCEQAVMSSDQNLEQQLLCAQYQIAPEVMWSLSRMRGQDGYERIDAVSSRGWTAIPSWGLEGWSGSDGRGRGARRLQRQRQRLSRARRVASEGSRLQPAERTDRLHGPSVWRVSAEAVSVVELRGRIASAELYKYLSTNRDRFGGDSQLSWVLGHGHESAYRALAAEGGARAIARHDFNRGVSPTRPRHLCARRWLL
jgi:hypothetical protein